MRTHAELRALHLRMFMRRPGCHQLLWRPQSGLAVHFGGAPTADSELEAQVSVSSASGVMFRSAKSARNLSSGGQASRHAHRLPAQATTRLHCTICPIPLTSIGTSLRHAGRSRSVKSGTLRSAQEGPGGLGTRQARSSSPGRRGPGAEWIEDGLSSATSKRQVDGSAWAPEPGPARLLAHVGRVLKQVRQGLGQPLRVGSKRRASWSGLRRQAVPGWARPWWRCC